MGEFILAMGMSGDPSGGGSLLTSLPFLLAIFAVMYFLMIRPQMQKQKKHEGMIQDLKKGDKIVTAGGIIGEIMRIEDDIMIIKVADNVKMRFQKQSVSMLLEAKDEGNKKAEKNKK